MVCQNPEKRKVQLHAKLDVNGIFSIETPQIFDGEGANPQPLQFSSITLPGLGKEAMEDLLLTELRMQAQTRQVVRLENLRNDLEALIYRQRESLGDLDVSLCTEKERSEHSALLQASEDWLYEEEDYCTTSEVKEKLREVGRGFCRLTERGENGKEIRDELGGELRDKISEARRRTDKMDERVEKIAKWLSEIEAKQKNLKGKGAFVPEMLSWDLKDKIKELEEGSSEEEES